MPILAYPRLDVPFILDTDACDSGLGVVLSQFQGGKEHVIAFAAHVITKAERNYSTNRKELLALVWGSEHFETYLYGRRFLARTDHNALQWLRNFKNPKGQVARWLERLSDFDFVVKHRPGSLHNNADGLSRLPWAEQEMMRPEVGSDVAWVQSVSVDPLSNESIQVAQSQDEVLSQVVKWLEVGVRPPRRDVEGGVCKLLSYWSQYGLVPKVLYALHDAPSAGHLGMTKTIERVRKRFFWHGLREDVENDIKSCGPCAERPP